VGLVIAWYSRRGNAVSPTTAAPGVPVSALASPSPPPVAPAPVLPAPASGSSDAAVNPAQAHQISRAVPVQQLPQLPAGAAAQPPVRNTGTRRTKPAGQPSGAPTVEDIPRNPYR